MTVKLIYPNNTQMTYCFVGMFKVDSSSIVLYFDDNDTIELEKTQRVEIKVDSDPKELTI